MIMMIKNNNINNNVVPFLVIGENQIHKLLTYAAENHIQNKNEQNADDTRENEGDSDYEYQKQPIK